MNLFLNYNKLAKISSIGAYGKHHLFLSVIRSICSHQILRKLSGETAMAFRRLLYVVALAITAMVGAAAAQSTGSISGSVKDSNGATISGATVVALNVSNSQRVTVVSDAKGSYKFLNLGAGTYRVIANSQGFAESAQTVSLDSNGQVTQDFSLSLGSLREVVTVTAGKGGDRLASETPQTVTVSTAEQIEQRVPRSTFEAMERAPNLASIESNPARERPRLRGLSSNRVLIVVDGEKLNNARSDPGATGAPVAIVEPSQLESIEVVAGSGSSLYGSDAVGGVINLITKGPERSPNGENRVGLRLDGSYGTNGKVGRGGATLNVSGKSFAMRFNYGRDRNANYKMGNGSVSLAQNVAMGNFFRQFPTNAAGTTFQSAGSYPIFTLSPNEEIIRGEGNGNVKQFDGWLFLNDKQNLRVKVLDRSDGYNGNAFSGPPYETQERYGGFRKYQKSGVRYQGVDITKWLARVSANYYFQKLSFPQDQFTWSNPAGASGSWLNATTFTGNASVMIAGVSGATFTRNLNTISTRGLDVQAALVPFRGMLITVGGGQTRDNSKDQFYTTPFTAITGGRQIGIGVGATTIGSSSPVSNYTDNNVYAQAEYDGVKYLRLSGGFRVDNWKSEGLPGNGFPLSTEFAALNAATPGLQASPGALTSLVAGLPQLVALAGGGSKAQTNATSKTYNFGIVGRLPYGINPYFRWASSYREPAITERYLMRNFTPGVPGLASLVIGNLGLKPEKGENYDVGIKITQSRFNFSLGYFRNEITDLLAYAPAQTYCVDPLPGLPGSASGFLGCPAGTSRVAVQINARINVAAAEIHGWESTGEASIPLGRAGSINPFYSLGSLYGINKSPTAIQIAQINAIYNRTDTPLRLKGSATDFPLANISPFRIIYGAQFLESKGRLFMEYSARHQSRVERVDPGQFVGTSLVNYGSFASIGEIDKHSIKGGYNWTRERYKMTFTVGVDNIADKLFWEQFVTAPAPGRSFVFGMTTEIFNFFGK